MRMREPLEGNVELNADQNAVVTKELNETIQSLGFLLTLLKDGSVEKETMHNALYVVEAAVARVCNITGIEMDSASEREARYADLRAANMRVHELERQIGAAVTPDALKAGIQEYARRIDQWWDEYGFGYISEMEFGKHGGCRLKLSCTPRGRLYSFSDTPVSDRLTYDQWLAQLEERGFTLIRDDGRHDEQLEDTPAARDLLISLVHEHFPTAKVLGLETVVSRKGRFVLRDISIYIHNFEEIANLSLTDSKAT